MKTCIALAQVVWKACSGEPQLWDLIETASVFETELVDVTRLHLGF